MNESTEDNKVTKYFATRLLEFCSFYEMETVNGSEWAWIREQSWLPMRYSLPTKFSPLGMMAHIFEGEWIMEFGGDGL